MAKKLCKLVDKGILKDDLEKYNKLIRDPKFVCRKCGRPAGKDHCLCKPVKMK